MKVIQRLLVPCLALICLLIASIGTAYAANNNWEHEILVYSLEEYGWFYDHNADNWTRWKSDIGVTNARDPYYDFWTEMNCGGPECMHVNSIRRRNAAVTVNNMVKSIDGWPDADMVFFYGHNTQIQPQWSHSFNLWRFFWEPAGDFWIFRWGQFTTPDWQTWGTPAETYRYHRNFITDASLENAYAVFYAYNPLTSLLIGEDFTDGAWNTENTYNQFAADAHTDKLGDNDIEWVIGHGCNAVTVADYNSSGNVVSIPLGVNAWKKSWGRLHTVLGHYHSTYTTWEPDLNPFAADIKAGDVIKQAYFDAHNGIGSLSDPALGQPAAISKSPDSCCFWWHPFGLICPSWGCGWDYMHSETWTNPMTDPFNADDYYYTTSWKVAE
jgi:hypothetical protein